MHYALTKPDTHTQTMRMLVECPKQTQWES